MMKQLASFAFLTSSLLLTVTGCVTIGSEGSQASPSTTSTENVKQPQVISKDDLNKYRWKLYSIYGERYILPQMPYLDFSGDGVTGFAGCNQFSGKYTLNSPEIAIGPLMTTKMACSNLQIENQILAAIQDSKYIYIQEDSGDVLKFFNADKSATLILQGIEKPE